MSNFSLTAQAVRRYLSTSLSTLALAVGLLGTAVANDNHTNEAQDQSINESFNKGVQGQSLQGKLRTSTLDNYSFETCVSGEALEKALAYPVENNVVTNGQLCYTVQSTAVDFNNRAVNNQINAIHQEHIEKVFALGDVDVNSDLYNETLVKNPVLYSEYILQHELEAPAEVSKLLINNKYQHLYQVFPAQSYATIQIADKGPRFISLKSQIDQYARSDKGMKLLDSSFANILLLQEQVTVKAPAKTTAPATSTPTPSTAATPAKPATTESAKPVTFSDPKAYAALTQSSALTLARLAPPASVTPAVPAPSENTPATPAPEAEANTPATPATPAPEKVETKVESKPDTKAQATTAPVAPATVTTSRYYVLGSRQAFKSNVDYLNFIEYLHKANYVATNAIYGKEFRFHFAGNGIIITYYQDNRYQKPVVVKYAEVKQFLKPLVLKALGIN